MRGAVKKVRLLQDDAILKIGILHHEFLNDSSATTESLAWWNELSCAMIE